MQPVPMRVFVSYCPADAAYGRQYADLLQARGIEVVTGEQILAAGGDARQASSNAIAACGHFVVILSPAAIADEWVNYLIDMALDQVGKGLVRLFLPVVAVPCATPLLLRRYKRVEEHNGQPAPLVMAADRTAHSLRAPAARQIERTTRQRSKSGVWALRGALGFSIAIPLVIVLVLFYGIHQTLNPTVPPTQTPYGGFFGVDSFTAVDMVAPNNGWIVGANGTIFHYDGKHWQKQASGTEVQINAIALLPDGSAGWAVGNNGTILRYQQGAWSSESSPTTAILSSLSIVRPDDAWAVGDQGVILHEQNGAWAQVKSPVRTPLESIAMTSATNGWITGDQNQDDGTATIVQYNGKAWSLQHVKQFNDVGVPAVAMLASDDGWFVGSFSDGSILYHYNGTAWTSDKVLRNIAIKGIQMTSASEGWAWGIDDANQYAPVIYHYAGATWTAQTVPQKVESNGARLYLINLTGISGTAADAWAVGDEGTILHGANGTWTIVSTAV